MYNMANPYPENNADRVNQNPENPQTGSQEKPFSPMPGYYQAYQRTSFPGLKSNIVHRPVQQAKAPVNVFNPQSMMSTPTHTNNPYQKYKEQSLSTLTQGELLVKLYEELIKQMKLAVMSIEKKSYDTANNALMKCEVILNTLDSSLDTQYELSKNLRDLYIFIAKQVHQGNIKKDIKLIQDCIPLIRDLRDAFDQAEKENRKSHSQHVAVGSNAL